MSKKTNQKLGHSVFFHLLAAIVLAGIVLTVTVLLGFLALRQNLWESLGNNLIRYARYMAADIGQPPDRTKALAISYETQMVIRYQSNALNWTVPAKQAIPALGRHYHLWCNRHGIFAGSNRQGHFIELAHGDGKLLFWLPRNRGDERKTSNFFKIFCAGLLMILALAYLYLRRIMQPLNWLIAAMDHFGQGNLAYRIPIKRHNEFKILAESMNQMASQIETLMQGKERLLLDVSHELRSPIARLKVGLEMLPETEARTSLQEDLQEMELMVAEILEAARMKRSSTSLAFERVEMAPLIRSVVEEFSQRPPGLRVDGIIECTLRLDPQKARVVLRNVIDNALKYSSTGRQPVEIAAAIEDAQFLIRVVDHGPGIPAEAQDRLFEPFFRADASRSRRTGGFGLGLSMCKTIMEAHGGTIRIHSQVEHGTEVTIGFPLEAV